MGVGIISLSLVSRIEGTQSIFSVFGKRTPPPPPGLPPDAKAWLIHHTEFDEPELDRLYKLFKHDYPRGGMFRNQFASFFPPGLASVHFCDHVFRKGGKMKEPF